MNQSNLIAEKQDLLITPNLQPNQLPTLLEQAVSVAPVGETRDMLLLSLLTNCGYALPAMRMLHGRPHHTYSPELLTMIVAPAASGKGIMNYGRLLLQSIEGSTPRDHASRRGPRCCNGKQVYIPANSSASALIKIMDEYDGRGIVFATEMDTLTQTLRAAYGHFGDLVRCIFEHETVSQLRRQNNEFIEIRNPRIAMLLSGTPNQVAPLLRNRENGLMSRFGCYVVNSRMDFDDHVWDVEEEGNMPSEAVLYDRLATELGDRYLWMETAGHECYFYLTDAQLKTIKRMFRSEYDTYSQEFGDLFDASLKRMPVIMKRIGMILTGLRLDMTKPLPERVFCSEEDFQTMLLIGHKLLMHAAMVFQMMPELKATPMGEIGGNMLQRQFFQMLPTDFTKQEAIQQAEVLGVSVGTMKRWLTKYTLSNDIQRVEQGKYRKKGA